ncbi:MAG: TetR/AcrR family transcriptional regulator [Thermoguttaceae bacterium]|jgi:AcrR family transcriptional regulator
MTSLAVQRKRLADSIMRDAIYDGVMEILDEHGLAGATMDRIAATVGVAKGSLYNHFRGKDDLLAFVHDRTIRPLLESTERVVTTDLAIAGKIEAMIRNWQRHVGEHRATFQILANYGNVEGGLKQAMAQSESAAIELIAGLITEGIEAGEFRPVKAHFVAEMLLVAVKKMLGQQLKDVVPRSDDETVDTLVAVFIHGLCAKQHQEKPIERIRDGVAPHRATD